MNLAVLLAWWNEKSDWLYYTLTSTRLIGATRILVADGAYALMPGGTARSSDAEYDAIQQAARDTGVPVTVYTPPAVWADNEREKRTHMFRMADAIEPDWICVLDADEVFVRAPRNLHATLAATDRACADVLSLEAPSPIWESGMENEAPQIFAGHHCVPRRCLFPWSPGLRIGTKHCQYLLPDNTDIWEGAVPLALTHGQDQVVMRHRTHERDPDRYAAQWAYYGKRDATGAEASRSVA